MKTNVSIATPHVSAPPLSPSLSLLSISGEWERGGVLNMIFSSGVSMYRLNVTSYWYRFSCRNRMSGFVLE